MGDQKYLNVPTEVARTILMIQQAGSLTKAAGFLGLTQSAISAQLRRIEAIVGGPIFAKTVGGSSATELGISVLRQCRRMIEANDNILAIAGFIADSRLLRLGLSTLLVRAFLIDADGPAQSNVSVHSDSSPNLARRFLDEQLDIVCMLDGSGLSAELERFVRGVFVDELVWVRSKNFELIPGAPLPIVTWARENDPMARLLTAHAIPYRLALTGGDYDTKKMAVEAGLGLTCIPRRHVPPQLVVADHYALPKLPAVRGILCARPNADLHQWQPVMEKLNRLFFDGEASHSD